MSRKRETRLNLGIFTYGHPVLRQKAEPVEKVNSQIRDLAEAMFKLMYERKGIGLAAQQVGKTIKSARWICRPHTICCRKPKSSSIRMSPCLW